MNKIDFIERRYLNKEKNEHVFFNDLLKNDISIILGEPASGKTFQFEKYYEETENCEFIELITLDLKTDIIDEEVEVVLLDSIDEALSKTDSDKKIKRLLITYIQECKKINPNIKFVISCRFVEWKEQFESALRKLDKKLSIFYIEDLSIEEIDNVLESCEINKDEFWEFINLNYLDELLKNIMMVIHIIENFQEYKNSKLKYFEIYKSIVSEHLLFKTDNERCSSLDKLNLEDRYKIASIIAIYMILNRKREISIEDFDRLSSEMYKLDGVDLNGENLKIVFDTSLFKGEVENIRFIHKSIQEYLAAHFIIEKKLDIETIKNIFAFESSFYEEFEEVIIYLTNIEEKFFKHLVCFDPIVFRRHPYLNVIQQNQLLTEMIKVVNIDAHKIWSKWEYLDDSSLVKFSSLNNIELIILENIEISQVDYELFSYLAGVLKNNYSSELEDVIFRILENNKSDKKKCLEYIYSKYIDNTDFNIRLFEFLKDNNLISKKNRISIRVFNNLYTKKDFNEIKNLLRFFSTYTDKRVISEINADDIALWLDDILLKYKRNSEEHYSAQQVSYLCFVIFKKYNELSDKSIIKKIFQALLDCKIYDLKFNISDYEKDEYKLNFDDIKDEFSSFIFRKPLEDRANIHNLMNVLNFYDIKQEDIVEMAKKYPIKDNKDRYTYFRLRIDNIDDFLMTDKDYKLYMENIWERQRKQEREWKREERPYRKLREKREKRREYIYRKAKKNLSTTGDIINILFHKNDIDEDDSISVVKRLKRDLNVKYAYFNQLIITKFKHDRLFFKIEQNILSNSSYYMSYAFSYLFQIVSDYKIRNIINTDKEFKKLFLHMIGSRDLTKSFFINIAKEYKEVVLLIVSELFILSLKQASYREHFINYKVVELLKKLDLYNVESLYNVITKIKEIDKELIVQMHEEDKKNLLQIIALDTKNYNYIKELMLLDKKNFSSYFYRLFSFDVNKAFNDFKELFHIGNNIDLKYNMGMNLRVVVKNKFDKENVCPISRKNFKILMGIIYDRHERTFQNILEGLNDSNIEFILDTYYKMFNKYYHPDGVYTPDIYDDMNSLSNKLFNILGENVSRLDLLNKLKDNKSVSLSKRAKYQIDNIRNIQLKNREFDNNYYKEIIDGYVDKEDVFFNYKDLENDLIDISLILFDSRHNIFTEEEDLINDRYRDALKLKEYDVLDQSRGGESKTTKKVGERDLLIQNTISKVPETVLEGFILNSNSKDVVVGHYEKLIKKYDVYGNEKNYMLAYCKVENFTRLCENYPIHFDSFQEIESNKENIFMGVTKIGDREIVHFLINFYSQRE